MVRGNLRLWVGLALFVGLVSALALIALNRDAGTELHGHWVLELVETPEGSFVAESGEWIEFEDGTFHGEMDCLDFNGTYLLPSDGLIRFEEFGHGGPCNQFEGTDYAFDGYFAQVSRYEFPPGGLTLQNDDASVQFIYVTEGA
jgi:hypothetical protein